MRVISNRNRPVHLGAYPLERLARAPVSEDALRAAGGAYRLRAAAPDNALAEICRHYARLYDQFRAGPVAPERAPVKPTPAERTAEYKALATFFDATLAGACLIPPSAWTAAALPAHTHALVFAVEEPADPARDNPAHALIAESGGAAAQLRATDIAVVLAATLRRLGFAAVAQTPGASDVALGALALAAGLARLRGDTLAAPFIGTRFALSAVTTDMALAPDAPLAPARPWDGGAAWWLGVGGTMTAWERAARRRRPAHWGRYPMERVRRVAETTTLILDDEVPRLPKRANGFTRARHGDLGEKAAREVTRFAGKTPLADATRSLIAAQQPYQNGQIAETIDPAWRDPARNRDAVVTLLHHLGADIAGTCEAKRYAWYSHELDGTPIDIYHRSAAVMVLDQGFETMEGASGDDWISATQSMRAYFRSAQMTGVVAAWIRSTGQSARSHTSIDSDVVHVPLLVLAGLGEMSRIGETVLNPFIGPRSKSAVLTTNMPLAWDQPIDFGLQDFCAKCVKCARECPCDAITYAGPVVFNGYEQWKQDVQRCTSYRVTNMGGSACGRCMKMCPWNNEGLLHHRILGWAAIKCPALRKPLARLDDAVGNGVINPIKRWWTDLEIVAGRVVAPRKINRRELERDKATDAAKQKLAYTHANMLPAPNDQRPSPMDHKAGVAAAALLETPAQARARHARGEKPPAHYVPTPLLDEATETTMPQPKDTYGSLMPEPERAR